MSQIPSPLQQLISQSVLALRDRCDELDIFYIHLNHEERILNVKNDPRIEILFQRSMFLGSLRPGGNSTCDLERHQEWNSQRQQEQQAGNFNTTSNFSTFSSFEQNFTNDDLNTDTKPNTNTDHPSTFIQDFINQIRAQNQQQQQEEAAYVQELINQIFDQNQQREAQDQSLFVQEIIDRIIPEHQQNQGDGFETF